jgi:hypothetical protein
MKRYVLRYAGASAANDSCPEASRLVRRAGGRVIDDAPNMLLVEGSPATCKALAELLPDWTLSLDAVTPLPGVPRPAVRGASRRS